MVQTLAEENNDSIYKPLFQKTDNNGGTCNVDWCSVCQIIFLLSIFGLIGFFLFTFSHEEVYSSTWPMFSLAVTSVDGLSPSSEPSATISPVFNLTLHVDNTNSLHKYYCVEKGKTRVLYQQVEVAEAPTVGFCMDGFLGEENMSIHTWHMELVLPSFLRDQLYEEVKEDKAVFDVQLLFEFDRPRVGSPSRSFIDCHQVVASGATFQCKHSVSFDTLHAN